jgi:hypothetical protein
MHVGGGIGRLRRGSGKGRRIGKLQMTDDRSKEMRDFKEAAGAKYEQVSTIAQLQRQD